VTSWANDLVTTLAKVRLEGVFNPYADTCDIHDLPEAPRIRRANLVSALERSVCTGVEAIWFGRDLGYRGGRRTGLALTDEINMLDVRNHSPHPLKATKATVGGVVAERTAAVIWSVIRRLRKPPLLWNAFPLHPHLAGESFSNRAHSARERRETAWTIEMLIDSYNRPRLVAIGNDASKALSQLGFDHVAVRHPSYGGQRDFVSAMERLHSLQPAYAETGTLL
jgi:hypothetical protein